MSNQDELKRRLAEKETRLKQLQALPDSYTNKEEQIKDVQTEIRLLWSLLTSAVSETPSAATAKPVLAPAIDSPTQPSFIIRLAYAVGGAVFAVVAGLAINLLSTLVEQYLFSGDGFELPTMGLLAVIALIGSFLGFWLSAPVKAPVSDPYSTTNQTPTPPATITITRLQLIFSKLNLRGRGAVLLNKVFSFWSKIEIDTRE